jgi:hypothetical protein
MPDITALEAVLTLRIMIFIYFCMSVTVLDTMSLRHISRACKNAKKYSDWIKCQG